MLFAAKENYLYYPTMSSAILWFSFELHFSPPAPLERMLTLKGGCIAQRYHYCLLSSSHGFGSRRSQKFPLDVAEIYQWRWLEESGQRLDNVNRTQLLALASATKVCYHFLEH